MKPESGKMFWMRGPIDSIEEACGEGGCSVLAHSMDCSPGQDGGALVNDDGVVLGVYSKVENVNEEGFYCATMVD